MRFLLLASILGLLWVASRLRKRQISVATVIVWGALWVAVGVVAFVPELTSHLADFLGIGRGADVVIYSAIVAIVALLFRLSIRIEQLDRAITIVTRELALRNQDRHRG